MCSVLKSYTIGNSQKLKKKRPIMLIYLRWHGTSYVFMQFTEPFASLNTGTCKMEITIQIVVISETKWNTFNIMLDTKCSISKSFCFDWTCTEEAHCGTISTDLDI